MPTPTRRARREIVMSTPEQPSDRRHHTSALGMGIAIGLGFGLIFGLMFNNLALGIPIGVMFGLMFGLALGQRRP
jgi:hypothetical protein